MAAITIAVAESMEDSNAANTRRDDKQEFEKCKLAIDGFDSDTANTQQMQQYAECVQSVYQNPIRCIQNLPKILKLRLEYYY